MAAGLTQGSPALLPCRPHYTAARGPGKNPQQKRENRHHDGGYLLVAQWFMSTWGRAQAFSESHWAHQENSMLKNEARREAQQLRIVLERV